ncbi:MAG: NAD(P)H dehydrogenase [Alphaproteobacteria bacterium]|nr:NAD(P)H dehydrogenase [Alphaproteobacteria bacterium]
MNAKVLFVLAHPDLPHSRANKRLAKAAAGVAGVELLDLYARHPDLYIEGTEAREAISNAKALVVQHPIYWYAMPGLLKEWFDRTFRVGWAYGPGGTALQGKKFLASITTGSHEDAYVADGVHGAPVDDFLAPMRQTVNFCGMAWLPPLIFHHARNAADAQLEQHAGVLVDQLNALLEDET